MAHTTIAEFHASLSREDRAICARLRSEIDMALPEATSKMWHAHPVTFLDGNPIVGYSRLKSCLRLFFWSGQSFQTPGLKASGSYKAAELRIMDIAQLDQAPLAAWLGDARDIQWDYKNIVKRKGELVRLK